jgi:hypothetical protein
MVGIFGAWLTVHTGCMYVRYMHISISHPVVMFSYVEGNYLWRWSKLVDTFLLFLKIGCWAGLGRLGWGWAGLGCNAIPSHVYHYHAIVLRTTTKRGDDDLTGPANNDEKRPMGEWRGRWE